jgi:DNA repair exonuclease SbcCD ATPase subunit
MIDGEEYIIVRQIERKKAKSGEWNVKTELDFFKKLADGQLQNFTGEQRRETESFIKNSIGDIDDFLMTILTTASNLEDLLEAKPTARGQVLSRFLGLEFLKKKEETGKELYSEFNKSMMSNVYNTETLKSDIEGLHTRIESYVVENKDLDVKILDAESRLTKGRDYKEGLISQKYNDIDHELIILNPSTLESEISALKGKINTTNLQIKEVDVVEPSKYFKEDEHDAIKESYDDNYKQKTLVDVKVNELVQLSKTVSGGIKCEHCGIDLMNAALTQAKLSEMDTLKEQSKNLGDILNELNTKEKEYVQIKKEFQQYEKSKLIKEKYELTIEADSLKLANAEGKLERYHQVQTKIEKNKNIEEQIIKANLRIDEIEREKTSHTSKISSNKTMIQNCERDVKNKLDIITQIASEFEKEKIYKTYLEIFGKNGISKMIMKTMTPLINDELQRLLQDSAFFKLEVRINDKNEVEFVMIDNGTGVEKLMASGSGFERTIASLALRAVLSKVCSLPKPNIVVFDEVFGKVSNENLDMVGEFFTKIKDYFEKVFVITHNPLVSNWANSIVKINKKDNISTVSQ